LIPGNDPDLKNNCEKHFSALTGDDRFPASPGIIRAIDNHPFILLFSGVEYEIPKNFPYGISFGCSLLDLDAICRDKRPGKKNVHSGTDR
jgi:hypothetical protein